MHNYEYPHLIFFVQRDFRGFVKVEPASSGEVDKVFDLSVRFLHCSGDAHIYRSESLFIDLVGKHNGNLIVGDRHGRRPADWGEAFLWLKELLKQKPEDETVLLVLASTGGR